MYIITIKNNLKLNKFVNSTTVRFFDNKRVRLYVLSTSASTKIAEFLNIFLKNINLHTRVRFSGCVHDC